MQNDDDGAEEKEKEKEKEQEREEEQEQEERTRKRKKTVCHDRVLRETDDRDGKRCQYNKCSEN